MLIAESGFLVYDKSDNILSPSAQGGFPGGKVQDKDGVQKLRKPDL